MRLTRCRDVTAEDTELTGGSADFAEGLVEAGGGFGFDIDEELVFPRAAVDGPAFDLEKIDTVSREWFKKGEERAGTVSEAHGKRNFAGILGNPRRNLIFRKQKHEAGEILGVVLDALGENHGVIMLGGAAAGNGGARFISPSEDFADAAGGVFRGNALP